MQKAGGVDWHAVSKARHNEPTVTHISEQCTYVWTGLFDAEPRSCPKPYDSTSLALGLADCWLFFPTSSLPSPQLVAWLLVRCNSLRIHQT